MNDTLLTDPLGRTVVLHDRTWFGHILKGHPDVHAERDHAENAIRSPAAVCFSVSDTDCRLYYGVSSRPGIMIVVVADVAAGFVKTAYRSAKVKGILEWP